eukprot:scaffold64255_cov24-Cyclotella_meneghiniana.AAC.2
MTVVVVVGSARPPASRRRAGVVVFVVRRPRQDAVSSVKRTLGGLQQHRDWSSTLAEPYTAMVFAHLREL